MFGANETSDHSRAFTTCFRKITRNRTQLETEMQKKNLIVKKHDKMNQISKKKGVTMFDMCVNLIN